MLPLGLEFTAERLKAEWRFSVIHKRNVTLSMEIPLLILSSFRWAIKKQKGF
jgi:hypothetical protein